MDPSEYLLYRNQTAVLAAISTYVARGYEWHLVTSAPQSKIVNAVYVINQRHRVLASRGDQHLRKVACVPRARLVLAAQPGNNRWPYALLADQRLSHEHMKHCSESALRWPAFWKQQESWVDTYELVQDATTTRWTWQLIPEVFGALLSDITALARAGEWNMVVSKMVLVAGFPMFRGIRNQARRIYKAVHQQWGDNQYRHSGGKWGSPPWQRVRIPPAITPVRVSFWVTPEEAASGRPRTLGDWVQQGSPVTSSIDDVA